MASREGKNQGLWFIAVWIMLIIIMTSIPKPIAKKLPPECPWAPMGWQCED